MLYCLCNRIYVCTHARGFDLAYFVTTRLQELIEIYALTKRRCYKRERVRIEAKGEALLSLKTLVTESGLIDDCEKKQRFTEECTLKLTVQLIDRLKREISTGRPSRVPQPLAQKVKENAKPLGIKYRRHTPQKKIHV